MIVCVSGAWSPSSSDEASASESGVDRRIPGCVLSSLAEAVDGSAGGVIDCDMAVGLLGGAAMTVSNYCIDQLVGFDASKELDSIVTCSRPF